MEVLYLKEMEVHFRYLKLARQMSLTRSRVAEWIRKTAKVKFVAIWYDYLKVEYIKNC